MRDTELDEGQMRFMLKLVDWRVVGMGGVEVDVGQSRLELVDWRVEGMCDTELDVGQSRYMLELVDWRVGGMGGGEVDVEVDVGN